MAEEIFIEPPIPDGDPQEQINALRAQLTMLQRTLDGMRRETIIDSSGRQFTVMAHRGPFVSDAGSAMAPYFEVKEGKLEFMTKSRAEGLKKRRPRNACDPAKDISALAGKV